jgi:hypothetical protein
MASLLLAISSVAVALGFTCLATFTCRVFRPDSRAARATAVLASALLLVTGVWDSIDALVSAEPNLRSLVTTQSVIHGTTVLCVYIWAATESLRYRAMMKRRLRLGLADPIVVNRLLLWGLTSVIVTAGILLNGVAAFRGVSIVESPMVLLGSSTTGLCQAVLLMLAFVPPRAYLAWVRGSVAAAPA